ncbi:MAG: DUF2752 domain-containing protein [Candidatus Krumholzibacteria bacterium]|nr:DUF2752 domain-containing protein [Candidatus Krumholzibacteria bacterium]
MRLVSEKSPLPRLLVFPFGILGLFGLAVVRFKPNLVLQLAHCPLRDMTGVPCPTCGGTHAAVALAHGRWADAFAANPLITAGLVLFGIWLLTGILSTMAPGLRRDLVLTSMEKRTARILAVLSFLAAWAWEIFR